MSITGNKVSLKLAGRATWNRSATPRRRRCSWISSAIVPHHTTLSGTVKTGGAACARPAEQRHDQSGHDRGLGNFGDVKVLLTSPPFLVTQYPFQRRGRGVL